ncbi:MAG: sigma-70 family RNA polymerase sigma factor [Opitutaceae bacterium]|nr:sigma-70 family RNA polymerase sigma factor [Opitutaceae bacterium]
MPLQTPDDARWYFEEVQPHERSVRSFLRAAAPSPCDVDDMLQDSYLRLFRARASGPIRCVRALFFSIARNLVRDSVRRKLANREISDAGLDSLPAAECPGVAEVVEFRQEQMFLAEAMQALPARCREVLFLRKIHGFSQKDIAARLGISENTVESLVSRGVRRCANQLRRRMPERCNHE